MTLVLLAVTVGGLAFPPDLLAIIVVVGMALAVLGDGGGVWAVVI